MAESPEAICPVSTGLGRDNDMGDSQPPDNHTETHGHLLRHPAREGRDEEKLYIRTGF